MEPTNLDTESNDYLASIRDDENAHEACRQFANATINARAYRLAGKIDWAMRCEALAEAAYWMMPADVRW